MLKVKLNPYVDFIFAQIRDKVAKPHLLVRQKPIDTYGKRREIEHLVMQHVVGLYALADSRTQSILHGTQFPQVVGPGGLREHLHVLFHKLLDPGRIDTAQFSVFDPNVQRPIILHVIDLYARYFRIIRI